MMPSVTWRARRKMTILDQPTFETPRLVLRLADTHDVPAILHYYISNQDFLEPYEPLRPRSFYTRVFWEAHIRETERDFYNGSAVRLFLFDRASNSAVIGYIGFFQIVRRAAHYCIVGYSLAQDQQGKGYMTEALGASVNYMFRDMNMHRIMANYMPHNIRSGRLLRKLGFVVEGYARDYLMINGKWEDHVLTSLMNPDWRPE